MKTDEENYASLRSGRGKEETGQQVKDPEEPRTGNRPATSPSLVGRVTAMRGLRIARPVESKSTRRRRTRIDIYNKDAEIPYVKFELAARDIVCSLMERQDRMNEEIFYKINDLAYRVGDLEHDRPVEGGSP
jgi:hypothetical protein